MKKLFLLLTVVCAATFTGCDADAASNSDGTPSQLEELQKRFDFSEVDIEGLQISEMHEFNGNFSSISPYSAIFEEVYTDLVAIIGKFDNYRWLGLFDRESGKLKYQYTDFDHPKSYFAYGIEYKYELGDIVGIHFEDNCGAIAIRYMNQQSRKGRFDLITFGQTQKTYRTIIADDIHGVDCQMRAMRWASNTIFLGFFPIIYDISKNEILCNVDGIVFHEFAEKKDFVSPTNPLHFWSMSYFDGEIVPLALKDSFLGNSIKITELQCTYDTFKTTEKDIQLFDPYTGDPSKAPHYTREYQTRTDDHISAVVTQTTYDGTVTAKTVDIRLVGDELKVEIQ